MLDVHFKEIKENRIEIHTSWFAVSETMTVLRHQYGYTEALSFNFLKILKSGSDRNYSYTNKPIYKLNVIFWKRLN